MKKMPALSVLNPSKKGLDFSRPFENGGKNDSDRVEHPSRFLTLPFKPVIFPLR